MITTSLYDYYDLHRPHIEEPMLACRPHPFPLRSCVITLRLKGILRFGLKNHWWILNDLLRGYFRSTNVSCNLSRACALTTVVRPTRTNSWIGSLGLNFSVPNSRCLTPLKSGFQVQFLNTIPYFSMQSAPTEAAKNWT
jgi:hypothetical protein